MLDDIEDLGAAGSDEEARGAAASARPARVARHANKRDQRPVGYTGVVPGSQRVWVKVFGCSHNVSDAEYMVRFCGAAWEPCFHGGELGVWR